MTSYGLNNQPLIGRGEYEASIACNLLSRNGAKRYEFGEVIEDFYPYFTQDGADREENPNQYIANMKDGAVAGYKYFDFKDITEIEVEFRGEGPGCLCISTELNASPIAQVAIDTSNDWQMCTAPIRIPNGVFPLYFKFCGAGTIDFKSFKLK